jgi:hypothetical protein
VKALLIVVTLTASSASYAQLEEDVAEAATASGLTTFVGLVIGALGTPAVLGVSSFAFGTRSSTDDLLYAAVIGGTLGAAGGGALGAWPTTSGYGPALVAVVAGGGALLGLAPAAYFGKAVYFGETRPTNDPIYLAHSGSLLLAVAASSAGAAITGGLTAAP